MLLHGRRWRFAHEVEGAVKDFVVGLRALEVGEGVVEEGLGEHFAATSSASVPALRFSTFILLGVRVSLPQRFVLPSAREAHSGGVDGWIVGKKSIDLGLHVVMGRNDVQKILDDAEVEIDA